MCDWAKSVWQLLLFWEAAPTFFCQISPLLYFCRLSYPLCLGSNSCFFYTFSSLCLLSSCCFFCQISPLLSSPLFCRWWNCPSPYIIWNMSWWSRTCEELGIISSRPYITFSSLLCYNALMLQVHDQMMIDMFLRPLPLLLLVFLYYCFIGLLWFIDFLISYTFSRT